jgi:hypothetical protein
MGRRLGDEVAPRLVSGLDLRRLCRSPPEDHRRDFGRSLVPPRLMVSTRDPLRWCDPRNGTMRMIVIGADPQSFVTRVRRSVPQARSCVTARRYGRRAPSISGRWRGRRALTAGGYGRSGIAGVSAATLSGSRFAQVMRAQVRCRKERTRDTNALERECLNRIASHPATRSSAGPALTRPAGGRRLHHARSAPPQAPPCVHRVQRHDPRPQRDAAQALALA